MSSISESLNHNLRFLIVEVSNQIYGLQELIVNQQPLAELNSFDRSGYIHNLKCRIHIDGIQHTLNEREQTTEFVLYRCIDNIAVNLERIAELCLDCSYHVDELNQALSEFNDEYEKLLDRVALGISLIEKAFYDGDSQKALKLADVQKKLDKSCLKLVNKIRKDIKSRKKADDLVSALFICKSIKSMGGALLKVCEAILSKNVGQLITIDRYHSLKQCVNELNKSDDKEKLVMDRLAETRSGSDISGISRENDEAIVAVFKEGKKQKLKEELQSVEKWHAIYPGVAPKILSYQKQSQSAALLIEHIDGDTFEAIFLNGTEAQLNHACSRLIETMADIWNKTMHEKPVNAGFISQLQKRLPDVYAVHPTYRQSECRVAGLSFKAFEDSLLRAKELEQQLSAPFSVYIHGDFNTDNIIYDQRNDKISYIDLHRSCYFDYVQDIAVFMVSNYRLKALDLPQLQRVSRINLKMYRFASEFANQHQDETFEFRLCLGLARSFASSTRFTFDKTLAKAMFYKARYLIDRLLEVKMKHKEKFRIPIEELFVG